MNTLLIQSNNISKVALLLELARNLHLHTRVLSEDEEMDMLLIKSIDEGMKSGEGSKRELKKMFNKHGIKI